MKINCICIGKTDNKALQNIAETYIKRLPNYIQYNTTTIPDIKNRKSLNANQQKEKEAQLILQKINNTDHVILLDENGKQYSSSQLAKQLQQLINHATKQLVLVIGGPYGFHDSVYDRANQQWSFSKMTFTHQMIRLFLSEQLYRATTIIDGKPYHHE